MIPLKIKNTSDWPTYALRAIMDRCVEYLATKYVPATVRCVFVESHPHDYPHGAARLLYGHVRVCSRRKGKAAYPFVGTLDRRVRTAFEVDVRSPLEFLVWIIAHEFRHTCPDNFPSYHKRTKGRKQFKVHTEHECNTFACEFLDVCRKNRFALIRAAITQERQNERSTDRNEARHRA